VSYLVWTLTARSDLLKRWHLCGRLRSWQSPGADASGHSRRELELIALRRFAEQGFDETTIDHIAAEAGVSRRTFFRYFNSKASVLWSDFDTEVSTIRSALADMPADLPMMDAIREAVVAANHYQADDVPSCAPATT